MSRRLENRSVEDRRKLRSDRWDQPECAQMRAQIRFFLESDDCSFLSDSIADTVEVEGHLERIRKLF